MDTLIPAILYWLYRLSLRAFPQGFRAEFESEMLEVFDSLLVQHTGEGWRAVLRLGMRELVQLPAALVRTYRRAWRKQRTRSVFIQMMRRSPFHPLPPAPDGRFSWGQTLLETSLLIVFAALLGLTVYGHFAWIPASWRDLGTGVGGVLAGLALPVFLLGLAHRMPRWAYPAAGILIGHSLILAQPMRLLVFWVSTLIAVFFLALMAVYVHLVVQPLPRFLQAVGRSMALDWTRLSFGFYGLLPAIVIRAFDDTTRNDETLYFALALLVMGVGALAYARSRRQPQQLGALVGGVTGVLVLAVLKQLAVQGPWRTTPHRWLVEVSWLSAGWALMVALLLLPMFASLICRAWADSRRAAASG
ncbi:MAG: hypothetical protein K8J31_20655 [Anaerolineae bacterium]|nr:hypothetical protein [Anaerolineae bacterium]